MKKVLLIKVLLILFIAIGACSSKDNARPEEEPQPYIPGNTAEILQDLQLYATSATASEHQSGEDISKALDGNFSTLFHSRWDQSLFPGVPVEVDLVFGDDIGSIDYMLYHPRKDGGVNGFMLETELWVKQQGSNDFVKLDVLAFAANSQTKRILFPDGVQTPATIRLIVTKGYNDFVSASQFEFFRFNDQMESYESLFTDLSFSALQPGVSRNQLSDIENSFIRNLALALYDGTYDERRVGHYQTYPDPTLISAENKTNRMGSYDNMTGIHVAAGEDIVVFVNETVADLTLRVVDHPQGYNGADYFLNPGPNRITTSDSGLIYLIYNTDQAHETKVNIATGTINGYFELGRHTQEDWEEMIAEASYGFFDLKGEKSHITFTTQELREFVVDAPRLLEVYDSIVLMQQQLMGLYKYDRVPAGRLYYRTNLADGVYMHATGNATEYAPSTLQWIANHNHLRGAHIWGPAHETGHIHQTRPGLMWVGLTEVTVNIYSQHVQTQFGNPSRLQTENVPGYANRYQKAFNEIIEAGIAHGAHEDVFCKLVPFWQLQLYFAKAQGYTDFYKDVHEEVRIRPNPPTDGLCQLEFVKIVCDVTQTDMTGFFQAWGFLTPIDMDINDYGVRRLTVTQEQIDEVLDYIAGKNYPAPAHQVQFITDNTVASYR